MINFVSNYEFYLFLYYIIYFEKFDKELFKKIYLLIYILYEKTTTNTSKSLMFTKNKTINSLQYY